MRTVTSSITIESDQPVSKMIAISVKRYALLLVGLLSSISWNELSPDSQASPPKVVLPSPHCKPVCWRRLFFPESFESSEESLEESVASVAFS